MHLTTFDATHNPSTLRTRGIIYCHKLMHQGIPYPEARSIASAIAKFDGRQRLPSPKQKQLIMKNSALICRAHLWRSDLLLATKAPEPVPADA